MGRQLRTKREGESKLFVGATTATSVASIDSNGVTLFDTTAAKSYVLAPPAEGVRKTLVCNSPTSAAVTVLLCTDGAASVTVGSTASTRITFNATAEAVVDLVGVNATRWAVVSVYPDNVAANATGTVFGTS